MEEFSINIANKYGVETYQDTKNTYDWIKNAINELGYKNVKIYEKFDFKISKLNCTCDNLEEFIKNAYKQNNYEFKNFSLSVYSNNVIELFVFIGFNGDISISSNKKVLLEKFEKILENTFLEQDLLNNHTSTTYIGNVTNNTISVKGNNNTIVNDNSHIETIKKERESNFKQWLRAIGQNIASNIV
ncbi:hypothetical protein [Ructibacterium gallinarum]|uniref:Uncharacterized protein n=1 Tax=Ructibacterium gallinarum TaxID=2779355 RepID=A0A9D5R9R6_9FIRM|nr:hypothetical protein [Ructibacterium gallinarum]MBE5041292.1 hypothetical protein [Ructibacterium gallinarum]